MTVTYEMSGYDALLPNGYDVPTMDMKSSTPESFWKEGRSTKRGPSRIRVTLNRLLFPSEIETIRDENRNNECPESFFYGAKVRVAEDQRIYAESTMLDSRDLYMAIEMFIVEHFVNVHPRAVRTFRELVR